MQPQCSSSTARMQGRIVVVEVVRTWTGREADALRHALRMTNEAFASHLGVAVRTVADWRKRPDMIPQARMQEVLDAALECAAERAKAQFALLLENDNRYLHPAGNQNGLTADDKDRVNGVIRRPSRLDAAIVENLSQVLASQRRAEDALGPEAILGPMTLQLDTLRKASDLATTAGEPPPSVYWYTEPFFRLNIGLAQLGIGQYRDAADSLRSGIQDIPADQQDAEWMNEYHQALAHASEHA